MRLGKEGKVVRESDKYEIGDYGGSQALIIKEWSRECEDVLKDQQLLVVLNQARGWKARSVSFLAGLEIERLAILAHVPLEGLESVGQIRNLKMLSLNCEPKRKVSLDGLENLSDCWLSWSKHYESVFLLCSLKKLGFSDFPYRDLSKLIGLNDLEELRIKGGKLSSFYGIQAFSDTLMSLELCALRRIDRLDELEQLHKLERLRIDGCRKVKSILPLKNLTNLRSLTLSDLGELDSLTPIQRLIHLEDLVFAESTDFLDGDLSCLGSLPSLREVAFQPRSHYSHTNFLGLTRAIRKPWKRK